MTEPVNIAVGILLAVLILVLLVAFWWVGVIALVLVALYFLFVPLLQLAGIGLIAWGTVALLLRVLSPNKEWPVYKAKWGKMLYPLTPAYHRQKRSEADDLKAWMRANPRALRDEEREDEKRNDADS